MRKRKLLLAVSLIVLMSATLESGAVTTAANRFYFTKNGTLLGLPYVSNKPLMQQDNKVTRILVSIHSSDYNAYQYLTNGMVSAAMVPGATNETLVIAPHFLRTDYIEDPIDTEMLYWNIQPYWGSQQARRGPSGQSINISAFEALDTMLAQIVTNSWYPNLKTVVIAGHSAGGQFVNRYAAGNRFENLNLPPGVHVRHVVMAPSSYVYFDNKRVVPGTDNVFQTPNTNSAAYNNYGYGLDNLNYAYLSPTGADGMRTNYLNRFVFYLVGSLDHLQDSSLDTGYAAMLQGSNRYERAKIYFNHVQQYFGPAILQTQHFTLVPNVGHTGRGLMTSPPGLKYLYDYDTNDSDGDGLADWREWLSGGNTTNGALRLSVAGTPPSLTWDAVRGRRYDVQRSFDLRSGFSTVFSTNGVNGTVTYPVNRSNPTSEFFKLSVRLD